MNGRSRVPWGIRSLRGRICYCCVLTLILLFYSLSLSLADQENDSPHQLVHVIRIEGTIGPIVADYLDKELAIAEEQSAELLIVELDTPGGLDTSMRQMVKTILQAQMPVVVFVYPDGARSASAGVFLLTAAHVAAMSPATNVGAAHPVNMGGEMDAAMSEKVTNDAVAYLQSLAEQRGRNVEWSEEVVRQSVSITADEALALGVIDLVATSHDDLLDQCNELSIAWADSTLEIHTAGARIVYRTMGWREKFLQRITDPTIAYILLMLGFYGLFFELSNPGSWAPGIIGVFCLLMAFLAFQSLPVNYVGIMLIILGLVLLLLEIKVTSYGMLSIAGITALTLGSILMFDSDNPFGGVPFKVIVPAVLFTTLFFLLIIGLGLAAQRVKHHTGREALNGAPGEVVRSDGVSNGQFQGRVFVEGELWEYRARQQFRPGDHVKVIRSQGRMVWIESMDLEANDAGPLGGTVV